MLGLLYKDFVSVNRIGKVKAIWVLLGMTILYVIAVIAIHINVNEQDTAILVLDATLLEIYAIEITLSFGFISAGRIMENDTKSKIRDYISSMPLKKNTYVASKYLFVGLMAGACIVIDYIWGYTYVNFCEAGLFYDIASLINSFIIPFICFALLLVAIELPIHIGLGQELTRRVIIVLWTAIFLIVVGYVMFGDVSALERDIDFEAIIIFAEKHKKGISIFRKIVPAIVLVLYYISYRISCYIYTKKKE